MAKKGTKSGRDENRPLPERLTVLCKKTFTAEAKADFFQGQAKEGREGIKEYLYGNEDRFELDLGVSKSFCCEEGTVSFVTRKKFDYDKDALVDLVKSGSLSIETLFDCIACFNFDQLHDALGSKVATVATEWRGEVMHLEVNDAFKAEIAAMVLSEVPKAALVYATKEQNDAFNDLFDEPLSPRR